jgi:hypothetical protein
LKLHGGSGIDVIEPERASTDFVPASSGNRCEGRSLSNVALKAMVPLIESLGISGNLNES